jgi:hypothetical protein
VVKAMCYNGIFFLHYEKVGSQYLSLLVGVLYVLDSVSSAYFYNANVTCFRSSAERPVVDHMQ